MSKIWAPTATHRWTIRRFVPTWAVLSWRNTYDDISKPPVSGVYLSVAVTEGGARQIVKPPVPLDLGSTGRLEVSVWL